MNRHEWSQVKEIFQAALELPESERSAYLAEACGDNATLREEVESLLASHDDAGDFIDSPPEGIEITGMAVTGDESPMTHIGPYRIEGELGVGGMGHVYLGVRDDGEFRKKVAIKVIRPSRATPSILNRFRTERQIMADVDHPNISRLLDGGTTDQGLPYFIMEYVDGEPIDAYCDTECLSVPERLALFVKVCDAVEFAHTKHVVHRDLKPGNILVTEDGAPKLLDFGIAKSLVAGENEPTADETAIGERVLTPAYASPEQVRGLRVTSQTDVYSLGVLLYLLLTGIRPYSLDDVIDYEKVICEKEPLPPSRMLAELQRAENTEGVLPTVQPRHVAKYRATTPVALRESLAGDLDAIALGALAKSPENRYESAAELGADVQRHLGGKRVLCPDGMGVRDTTPVPDPVADAPSTLPEEPVPAPTNTPQVSWTRWAGLGIVVALAAAATWAAMSFMPERVPELDLTAQPIVGSVLMPQGTAYTERDDNVPSVSPDGSAIVFAATDANGVSGLWTRAIFDDTPSRVPFTDAGAAGFWSPAGDWLGYFADSQLLITRFDGVESVAVATTSTEPRGGTANARGDIVFSPDRGTSLHRARVGDRGSQVLAEPQADAGEIAYMWPDFLPDDDHFIYFVESYDADVEGIYVRSLSNATAPRRLLATSASGVYSDGYLFHVRGDRIVARRLDLASLSIAGDEEVVVRGVDSVAVTRNFQSSFSIDGGVIAFEPRDARELVWLNAAGFRQTELAPAEALYNPTLARDGSRAAIEVYEGGRTRIDVLDLRRPGGNLSVYDDEGRARHPVLSDDGRWLAYSVEGLTEHGVYYRRLDSSGDGEELYSTSTEKMPSDISPDGRFVLVSERSATSWDVNYFDRQNPGAGPQPFAATDSTEHSARFSPSGSLIAHAARYPERIDIYVRRFEPDNPDTNNDRCIASTAGGYDPYWGVDDTQLFYLEPNGRLMRVTVDMDDGCNLSEPTPVFHYLTDSPGTSRNHYAFDVNASRFLFNQQVPQQSPITYVLLDAGRSNQ